MNFARPSGIQAPGEGKQFADVGGAEWSEATIFYWTRQSTPISTYSEKANSLCLSSVAQMSATRLSALLTGPRSAMVFSGHSLRIAIAAFVPRA